MAHRRTALAGLAAVLALASPACRFSRNASDAKATTTSASLVPLLEDTSTSVEDTTTIAPGATSTTRKVATTLRTAQVTTRPTTRTVTTAHPAPAVPHCDASMSANPAPRGSRQILSVSSTAPNANVSASLTFYDANGQQTSTSNFSGYTADSAGSWSHQVSISASYQTRSGTASVTVGSLHCSTTFAVA